MNATRWSAIWGNEVTAPANPPLLQKAGLQCSGGPRGPVQRAGAGGGGGGGGGPGAEGKVYLRHTVSERSQGLEQ